MENEVEVLKAEVQAWKDECRQVENWLTVKHADEMAKLKRQIADLVERYGSPAQIYMARDLTDPQNFRCLEVTVNNLVNKLKRV
jgi:hypothetical protein